MALYLTNIEHMAATRNLNLVTSSLNTSFKRLSSGLRINSAKDDPAGLQIADRLTAQINGYRQGSRNLNDGISVAQTMEGALDESKNMLQRIRTLAVQAANGTYSDDDRRAIDIESVELCSEITRIAKATTFAGTPILDGNSGGFYDSSGNIKIKCSGQAGDYINIPGAEGGFTMSKMASTLGFDAGADFFKTEDGNFTFSLTSAQNAESVIACVDKYLSHISTYQSRLGAVQNRFESAIRLNDTMSENLSDARSRIQDTDYAEEVANLSALMVKQNIISMLFSRIAQSKNIILSLLGA